MSVLTENDIRKMMSVGTLKEKGEIFLGKDTILTPSAQTFLNEKNISIHGGTRHHQEEGRMEQTSKDEIQESYQTVSGLHLDEKPEFMTHLRGTTLVYKDHPKIQLRGAIDSLESEIIITQTIVQQQNKMKLVEDLQEVIVFIRKLLRCEITGEGIGSFSLLGLDEAQLRDQSYHPSKYFGMKHFLPTYQHGEVVARLNRLRTMTREVELIAFRAFHNEFYQIEREDIIQAFNRLSSLFWILMFRYLTGKYD